MQDKHTYNNNISSNVQKYSEFISFCRFYPDLALDLFRVENGGATIYLGYDQRIFMRCKARFKSIQGVFSRGYSKTFLEVATEVLMCIFYPSRDAVLSAQTKENAANILQAKWKELIKYFPLLENEVEKTTFTKNDGFIKFKNGSTYRVLANAQSSKGSRSCSIAIEESALLNDEILKDAMLPIIEVPRMLVGKKHISNPCEFNTIGYFTTPIFRGSDDYNRCVSMINNMSDLNGSFAIGSSWILPSYYNRGSSKKQILEKAKDYSPVEFAWNYLSKYTGSSAGALIAMNKLMRCRNMVDAEYEADRDGEYYIAVDVARSQYDSNNKSSITVGKVIRNEKGKIQNIYLVNIFNISNTLNFTSQSVIIKKTRKKYNAKVVVVDGNGLGAGLVDALLSETIDPETGENLGCWDTINTTNQPQSEDADQCVYDLKAQSAQSKIITDLIDSVDSGVLRLLETKQYDAAEASRNENYQDERMPFIQTDLLCDEISNLKLETNGKNLMIKKVSNRLDKDRVSSLMYLIYYIIEYESDSTSNKYVDFDDIFTFRAPEIRR